MCSFYSPHSSLLGMKRAGENHDDNGGPSSKWTGCDGGKMAYTVAYKVKYWSKFNKKNELQLHLI